MRGKNLFLKFLQHRVNSSGLLLILRCLWGYRVSPPLPQPSGVLQWCSQPCSQIDITHSCTSIHPQSTSLEQEGATISPYTKEGHLLYPLTKVMWHRVLGSTFGFRFLLCDPLCVCCQHWTPLPMLCLDTPSSGQKAQSEDWQNHSNFFQLLPMVLGLDAVRTGEIS